MWFQMPSITIVFFLIIGSSLKLAVNLMDVEAGKPAPIATIQSQTCPHLPQFTSSNFSECTASLGTSRVFQLEK